MFTFEMYTAEQLVWSDGFLIDNETYKDGKTREYFLLYNGIVLKCNAKSETEILTEIEADIIRLELKTLAEAIAYYKGVADGILSANEE